MAPAESSVPPDSSSQVPARPLEPSPDPERGHEQAPNRRRKHEEKITVYCSGDELLALERARLDLRAEYGIAVDRGRIVREALSAILADLVENGPDSTLIRRLKES